MIAEVVAGIIYILVLVWIVSIASSVRKRNQAAQKNGQKQGGRRAEPARAQHVTVSSDGHKVPASQDLTCEQEYGHVHDRKAMQEAEKEYGRRYVVHEEPTEGWVVLNGVKRKIEDCKNL